MNKMYSEKITPSYKSNDKSDSNIKSTNSFFIKGMVAFLWLLFAGNLVYLALNFKVIPNWLIGDWFRINGFTILLWTTVTFFSAIVTTYAKTYLKGFTYNIRFMVYSLGFTFSVLLLVASNHLSLLLLSWLLMGFFMANLIGVNRSWAEAKEASKFAQRYFLTGSLFLGLGLFLLAITTGNLTITGITNSVNTQPIYIKVLVAVCIIIAALIQSAIYPFHRWLLSAMTSPTPASALMHAGFVNGSGILLALFASVLFASNTLNVLFIIGGLTALIAQFTKLIQVNVKQKLACSTIAQMGFMIMQCGLGFFNAAIVHLILHGFYKSYLFLSSGEEIVKSNPKTNAKLKIQASHILPIFLFSVLGAFLFAWWTGKGTQLDSGLFLTIIVAMTVGQATYNILKERSLTLLQKTILPALLFVSGIGLYALMYNGVTHLMSDMPMIDSPLEMSGTQITFNVIFLIGFFVMKLEVYKKIPWLYVKLMNISQPYKKTVLMYKSN